MPEPLPATPATDAGGHLPGTARLAAGRGVPAADRTERRGGGAGRHPSLRHMAGERGVLYLRYAPAPVLLSGPPPEGPFIAVEIGHGLTRFRLRGVEALHFLGHCTRVDLHAAPVT